MAAFLDNVRFTPTAAGTTDWTYSVAVTGYQSPAAGGVVNSTVYKGFAISADLIQWEICQGAYNTGTGVLPRTTVLYNSSGTGTATGQSGAGTKINFTLTPQVAIIAIKEDLLSIEEANSFTAAQQAQARSNLYAAPFDALAYSGMQVNGSCDVSQELGTTGATLSSAAVAKYVADCFWSQYTGATGVLTSAQIASSAPSGTAVVGLPNAVNLKATTKMAVQGSQSDGDFACIAQTIEGYRIARLGLGAASPNSFSIGVWWYSTNAATTFFRVSNVASGAGRYYYQEVTLSAGWNYVTATIPGDTTGTWQQTNSAGMVIKFFGAGKNTTPVATTAGVAAWSATEKVATTNSTAMLSTTNNDQIAITGLTILPGTELPSSTRAPLIMRPFDQELMLCKRYYEKSYNYATAVGTAATTIGRTPILNTGASTIDTYTYLRLFEKSKAPTMVGYNPSSGATGYASFDNVGTGGGTLYKNLGPLAADFVQWSADARL